MVKIMCKKSVWLIFGLCLCSLIQTKPQIIRAIMASDNNPTYLDFWPIVAQAWGKIIGIRPTLALIADKNTVIDETIGDVIRFDPIPGVSTAQHAQLIRMLLPIYYPDDICIISDIDMLPLNKGYFLDPLAKIGKKQIIVYHDRVYKPQAKRIPMCYVAGKGNTFKEVFHINAIDEIPGLIYAWSILNPSWTADEEILYTYLSQWHKWTNYCQFLGFEATFVTQHRIDRFNWQYNIELLRNEFYHDAHLLRPLSKYEKELGLFFEELGLSQVQKTSGNDNYKFDQCSPLNGGELMAKTCIDNLAIAGKNNDRIANA